MVAAAIVLPANPFRSSRLVRVIPSPCSIGTRFGQHLLSHALAISVDKSQCHLPSKALTPGVIMEAAMLKKAILLCAMMFLAGSSPGYAQRQTQTGDVYVRVVRTHCRSGIGTDQRQVSARPDWSYISIRSPRCRRRRLHSGRSGGNRLVSRSKGLSTSEFACRAVAERRLV